MRYRRSRKTVRGQTAGSNGYSRINPSIMSSASEFLRYGVRGKERKRKREKEGKKERGGRGEGEARDNKTERGASTVVAVEGVRETATAAASGWPRGKGRKGRS